MKKNINRNEIKSQKWFVFRRVNMTYSSKCMAARNMDVPGSITTVRPCAPALSLVELFQEAASECQGSWERVHFTWQLSMVMPLQLRYSYELVYHVMLEQKLNARHSTLQLRVNYLIVCY
ncbi:uncharacterized protein LOC110832510 isoform X2 [Zootermopsis nevadensis]|uniref:uncharacterized protein LOC110832510 isoform X2 n=1 Tax=Zootermopsis nevadensis TaxID=136037 RepID=UPI000B8EE412|nr:uncharacterized protein LOC110832510 isoform X2 [Zootermopsis nevadensis]